MQWHEDQSTEQSRATAYLLAMHVRVQRQTPSRISEHCLQACSGTKTRAPNNPVPLPTCWQCMFEYSVKLPRESVSTACKQAVARRPEHRTIPCHCLLVGSACSSTASNSLANQ